MAVSYLNVRSIGLFLCLCLAATAAASPAPLTLDDAPQLLAPQRPRTEADRDHVEALALWAAGRTHQHREEFAEALRCYERALRCDPQSPEILQAIVSLADQLNRHAEAARYALKDVQLKDADPMLLRRLGVYLAGEGDWASAAALYEKALAVRNNAKQAADVFLRMELARIYLMLDNYKRAAECFARVIHAVEHPAEFALDENLKKALLDEPGPTYQLMGECFLAADRPEEARAVFQKVEELAPNRIMRQYNLARVYAKTGKPAEALAALEACFAEKGDGPDSPRSGPEGALHESDLSLSRQGMTPYQTLADVLEKLGKKDELIERLKKLHVADPQNLPLGYFLAERLRDAGNTDEALSLYRKLLDHKPMSAGYSELAEIHRRAKRFDALLSVLGESVEKIGVLETLEGRSQSISGDKEAMRGIVEAARNKIKSAPGKPDWGTSLAVALLSLEANQYETADEFFRLARDADPQRAEEVLLLWGVGLLSENQPARSAKVLRQAVERTAPKVNPTFHFYLAGALALEGQTDDALAAARLAAENRKSSASFRGRPAWVLYYGKRNDEAAEAYRKLIDEFDADRLVAENRDVLREARLALSNLSVIKGDLPQAEEWLEQVLDEFPDDPGAMNDLGYLWADQGKNLHRAERMIRRAVAAEPDNRAYRDSLGWVLFRGGKYAQAVTELEKAAADPDGMVLDHLGDAYLKAGQRNKALQSWRKAAEEFRKEKEFKKEKDVAEKIMQNAN